MSGPPPPPPPPHGEAPKTTAGGGLPPGKYDIFVIPQHSAGSGFLYLPSLRPNINSFVAGFASALALVVLGQSMAPAFRAWWATFQGMGNMGMLLLLIAVGLGAWVLGRAQQDGAPAGEAGGNSGHDRSGHGSPGGNSAGGNYNGTRSSHNAPPNGGPPPQPDPPPHHSPPPQPGPPPHSAPPPRQRAEPPPQPTPPPPQQEAPKPSWQKPPPAPKPEPTKGAWEKAREETRRKEEERKAEEEARKRKEAAAQRLKELREKEARERAQREKERLEREAREQAEKTRKEKELKDLREKEQRERDQRAKELREKLEREAKLKAEQERLKKEEEEKQARKGSTYAFSAVGERTNPWPNSRPPAATSSRPAAPSAPSASPSAPASAASSRTSAPASSPAFARAAPPPSATASSASSSATARPSPSAKKPKTPTAKTFAESEEEMYSFRPYDKPKRPSHKKSVSDFSETSWTPSYSTSHTTPPPSSRGPYSTKDPDKIVIKAVYSFLNAYAKTPSSQLIAAVGNVTDGLILRITTEGLFIDDDVRGVPQREWDVKAWTLKLVEVWCPSHVAAIANAADKVSASSPASDPKHASFLRRAMWRRGARDPKPLAGEDANAYLVDLMAECEDNCRLGLSKFASPAPGVSASASAASASSASTNRSNNQTGGWNAKGLHLLRATLRDQDEKRYLFVLGEEEAWKLSMGVQRLVKGGPATMTRAVGVQGMSAADCRNSLEMLGWA